MGSGDFSHISACIQDRRLSTLILDRPPALLCQRRKTAQSTFSYSDTASSTGKGVNATGMLRPGGGNLWLSLNLFVVIYLMVNRSGGGWVVFDVTVPPLHPNKCLLRHKGIRREEGLHHHPCRLCAEFVFLLRDYLHLPSHILD